MGMAHWAFSATTASKLPYWKKTSGKEIMTQQEKELSKHGTGGKQLRIRLKINY
jgi:hypothetical protein